MAAPKPGVGKRKEQARQAQTLRTIEIRGEEVTKPTAFLNLPIKDLTAIVDQSGHTLDWWMGNMSMGSIRVFWWVSRRVNGEPLLTLEAADADFVERFPDLQPAEVDIIEDDGKSDDPQP
jgi:hypothetical protein